MDINVEMTPSQMRYIDDTTRELLVEGSAGSGKGLCTATLIPTPTGWTTMGELSVGDELFDEKGTVCHVTYKSPIHHIDCYQISFENGFKILVDGEHRWKCQTGNYTQNRVWNTREMYEYLEKQNRKVSRGFIVDMADPLQLSKRDLPIEPYVLGAWLGDGSSYHGVIYNHISDHQIIEEIKGYGWKVVRKPSDELAYSIWGLKPILRDLNVLENKNIPIEYLRGSFEQRLSLLQGIMDTDGTIDENGNCEIIWSNYIMLIQLRELLFTLGIKTTTINKKKVQLDEWESPRTYYRLHFTTDLPVFRLKRKLERIPNKIRKTQKRRYIKKIEKIETVPTQCITVDSDSSLFLATEEFIPTHNTIFACYKTIFYALKHENARIYVYRVTLPSLKKTAWLEIRNLLYKMGIPYEEKRAEGRIEFENGSVINFGALDELSKVRSINADLIYIEQAEELLNEAFYVELMLRLGRGEASKQKDGYSQMLLVVQPESEEHWIYKHYHEYNDAKPEKDDEGNIIKTYEEVLEEIQKERKTVHFHYSENYKLPPQSRKYYDDLKNVDYELWLRYSAGKWGKLSDVIYPNYDTVVVRDHFDLWTIGGDFGYNNPSCILLCAWFDDECYVMDEIYEPKLLNSELIAKTSDMLFRHHLYPQDLDMGWLDSAEPDRIEEFRQNGYPVEGGIKDVKAKISTTKQTKIHIHPRCVNTIREIKGYKYKTDKDGVVLDEPVKVNDHAMDAMAYCCYGVRGQLSADRPYKDYNERIMVY